MNQAFSLGWNISMLYMSGAVPGWRQWTKAPARLPSPTRFSQAERALIRLGQVRSAINSFNDQLGTNRGASSLLSTANEYIGRLSPKGVGDGADPRASLCEAHLALAEALSASDARLAKAYHLGGELAVISHAPKDLESLRKEFSRPRIARLGEWLADLTSLFPDHASRAVRLSCAEWRRWVEEPKISVAEAPATDSGGPSRYKRAKAFATRETRDVDWKTDGKEIRRALARQGEVWRALLSGEKPGREMLELQDYFTTGARALKDGFRLLRGVRLPLCIALALLLVGTWLLTKDPGAGATAAGIVTVAGSAGIAWKGILGGLGTVISKLQGPVWGAALDEEIASAITELPAGARAESEEASEAAPASGPQPSVLPAPPSPGEAEAPQEWNA